MPNTITFQSIIQGDASYTPDESGVILYTTDAQGKRIPTLTLDEIDPSEITEYTFVNQDRNLGLSVRAKDRIQTFELLTDDAGRYNADAYALAQFVAFAEVYCTAVSWRQMDGDGGRTGAMPQITRDALCELPEGILRAYYNLSNKGVSLAALKKRPKDGNQSLPTVTTTND